MTRGLRKETCLAAFLGLLTVSGLSLIGHATPAHAADLGYGGNCCADLEERVAELEATTARKGNKKVTVQIYGKMNRAIEYWDDGSEKNTYVVNNGFESSRFGMKGESQIAPGWKAGYRWEVEMTEALSNTLNQNDWSGTNDLHTRHSFMYLSSEKYGELRWGLTSAAKDDITKDAMPVKGLNDTITSDMGANRNFFLRSKGTTGTSGLSTLTYGDIGRCYSSGDGFDCSTRRDAVAYWSPKFYGFQFSTDYASGEIWSAALRFKQTFGAFSIAADGAYEGFNGGSKRGIREAAGSASIMHNPSGLYAFFSYSTSQDHSNLRNDAGIFTHTNSPDMNAYDIQGGWEHKFNPVGDTTFFGGYAKVHNGLAGAGGNTRELSSGTFAGINQVTEITGSDVSHWYMGVDQGIDPADLHLYIFYEHFTPSVNLVNASLSSVSAPLDDFDLVFAGARIYF